MPPTEPAAPSPLPTAPSPLPTAPYPLPTAPSPHRPRPLPTDRARSMPLPCARRRLHLTADVDRPLATALPARDGASRRRPPRQWPRLRGSLRVVLVADSHADVDWIRSLRGSVAHTPQEGVAQLHGRRQRQLARRPVYGARRLCQGPAHAHVDGCGACGRAVAAVCTRRGAGARAVTGRGEGVRRARLWAYR